MDDKSIKEYLELANNLDYYDSSGGSAPAEAADVIRALVDRLKESQHLADVMETMIPLTVCDEELKRQWRKLLAKYNGEGK